MLLTFVDLAGAAEQRARLNFVPVAKYGSLVPMENEIGSIAHRGEPIERIFVRPAKHHDAWYRVPVAGEGDCILKAHDPFGLRDA